MKYQFIIVKLFVILFSIIFYIACNDELNEKEDIVRLKFMEQEILELIVDLICSDSTDCRYIGFGAKPCGGPWKYLIYSKNTVDSILLIEKVNEYNDYNNTLNLRYGWSSDCSLTPIPVIGCVEGICVDISSNHQ